MPGCLRINVAQLTSSQEWVFSISSCSHAAMISRAGPLLSLALDLEDVVPRVQLSRDLSVPLVAFSINKRIDKDGKAHTRTYDEFDLADRLHARGWILPAYNMCKDCQCAPCSPAAVLSAAPACAPQQDCLRGCVSRVLLVFPVLLFNACPCGRHTATGALHCVALQPPQWRHLHCTAHDCCSREAAAQSVPGQQSRSASVILSKARLAVSREEANAQARHLACSARGSQA